MANNYSNLDCPHCGERAVSPLQKAFMSREDKACRACGQTIGIDNGQQNRVTQLFLCLLIVIFGALAPGPLGTSLGVGVIVISYLYHFFWVRLETRVGHDRPTLDASGNEVINELVDSGAQPAD